METTEFLAKRLIELRNERGLTQNDVSEGVGVSRQSIAFYEKESRTPDAEVIARLADYFNVSTDYLLGITNNRTNEYAGIGNATGLSDEAITRLHELVEAMSHNTNSGMNMKDFLSCSLKKEARRQLMTLNILITKPDALNIIGKYLFDEADKIMIPEYKLIDDCEDYAPNDKMIEEANELSQAVYMYRIQKELIKLREKLNTER
ncbi:MAG: helix-turn-helix transcriptional regulator [Clostridiales bacterium]|nr:helix-turn-helix transcriptional regulator [Clostridiales bacterium]